MPRKRPAKTARASPRARRSEPGADYRLLFLSNPQPMWVFDRETLRFLAVNDAAVERYGYSRDEFLGMTILEIRPPEDRAVVRGVVDALPAEGLGYAGCWRHRTKEGALLEVELSTHMVVFEERDAVMVTALDVTAQRQALRRAERGERELHELTDALERERAWLLRSQEVAKIGAWETDLVTLQVQWSAETYRIFGLDPAAFTPTHTSFLDFVHPDDRAAVDAGFRDSFQTRELCRIEHRILPRGGGTRVVEECWYTTAGPDGSPLRAYGTCQDITERRAAEAALQASETRFRTVFETAASGIVLTSPEGVLVDVNPAFCEMVGRPADTLKGSPFRDLTHPDDVAESLDLLHEVMRGEHASATLEKRYLHSDGHVVWCRLSIAPHIDAGGTRSGCIVVVENVTRQRETLEALQASEERFRLLARATNDAIWDWDLRTNALWWNEGYEILFGYSRIDVAPDISSWTGLVHPEDAERVIGGVHEAIDAGAEQWSDEYRFRRKDGSFAYVLDRGHIIRHDGQAIRMIGGMTDLSERRAAEERLAEQAALLDSAHEAIAIKDLDDRIVYWNKGAERTYGWSAAEVVGRPAVEVFGVDQERHRQAWQLLLEHGTWDGELRRRGKDGTERIVEVRWTLVRRPDGTPRAVFAIHTDITERRRMEAQFLRAQRLDSIGTLAGGIAHDLNNVLTPIVACVGLLREPLSDVEREETLDAMEEAARRGAAMVRQVLTFARGAEGTREPVDLRNVVAHVAQIIRETFPKSITLQVEVAPAVHPISADPTQLHQVLLNLCVNARDAMPEGGTLTIRLENVQVDPAASPGQLHPHQGEHVRLSVIDDGVGIPPEIQDHIFEPFFTTKEPGHGTGLGLSTVHSIVRAHGGFVLLTSAPGRGTRFDVHVPADPGAVAAGPSAVATEHLPKGQGEVILLVDDEDGIRRVIRRMLERFGYRVLEAANGAEGLARFARHRREVDVVLTDMSMPVMDGPSMITAILALDPEARIIASSGLAEDRDLAGLAANGTRGVVPKPYTAETLLTALREALRPPR